MNRIALGVVILGAGASSRMGRPKLLLPWGDTSIVGHLIRQWHLLGTEQIAIVCRAGDKPLADELDRLDFPPANRIENPEPERGMFSSIVCAANWQGWKSELTSWAIVLGDQPQLRTQTLGELVKFYGEHPDKICQPTFEDRAKHPVFLPRAVFQELKAARKKTLKEFLGDFSNRTEYCPLGDPGLAFDLDTPEDYQRATGSKLDRI